MNSLPDIQIDIATANSRMAKCWKNKTVSWAELAERCCHTTFTAETAAEYRAMTRDRQSEIKDTGGFVAGFLTQGLRRKGHVAYRTAATLDLDFARPDVWQTFTSKYHCAALLYSTHKHTDDKPRFRLVIPFSRHVTPEEYEPVCRKIAEDVGIEQFDDTTYELPRLFYWPSTSKGAPFVFRRQDAEPLNPDSVLARYHDPNDVSEWPRSEREGEAVRRELRKAEDPTLKGGLIGAFCRAYPIEDAIEQLLPEVYEPTTTPGRYSYREGSVAGGLVCYDGKFAYSHHNTDPAGGQLCNAFDLVRIHRFGARDEGSRVTDPARAKSFIAMQEWASADQRVRQCLAEEKYREAERDFADFRASKTAATPTTQAPAAPPLPKNPKPSTAWTKLLEYAKSGTLKNTNANARIILRNDPTLSGRLHYDEFRDAYIVRGGLPWDGNATSWTDNDEANLRCWLEDHYGKISKENVSDALCAIFRENSFHPIRTYLDALRWDGKPRLDTMLSDYLGADDSPLTRTMTRKHFAAAVARIYHPGTKYDYCLILTGREGIGKSTLLSVLGGEWFNDSIVTMEGKEGMESLRGAWLVELGELSSMKRSDVESIKAYLSKQTDKYRAAYTKNGKEYPRQCVFCGTTNEDHFLKGNTGNRRFWVVRVGVRRPAFTDLRETIAANRDQIWAEAVHVWKKGETLFLDRESEKQAKAIQEAYNDDADDPLPELLTQFLDTKLPADWNTYDLDRRRAYLNNPDPLDPTGTVLRDKFCAAEFLCERMKLNMTAPGYKYEARKICKEMRKRTDEWEEVKTVNHVAALYGRQIGFRRKIKAHGSEDEL